MSAIGSLVFCTDCGNLLDGASGKENAILLCDVCGASNRDTSSKTVVTRSKPSAFPSALRAKRSEVQTVAEQDQPMDAMTDETCKECGQEEVQYFTMQLRGADEGTTVFYTCPKCGNKWNNNN